MPIPGFFDGQFKASSRVALGGASRDRGDRAQLLEQARFVWKLKTLSTTSEFQTVDSCP